MATIPASIHWRSSFENVNKKNALHTRSAVGQKAKSKKEEEEEEDPDALRNWNKREIGRIELNQKERGEPDFFLSIFFLLNDLHTTAVYFFFVIIIIPFNGTFLFFFFCFFFFHSLSSAPGFRYKYLNLISFSSPIEREERREEDGRCRDAEIEKKKENSSFFCSRMLRLSISFLSLSLSPSFPDTAGFLRYIFQGLTRSTRFSLGTFYRRQEDEEGRRRRR